MLNNQGRSRMICTSTRQAVLRITRVVMVLSIAWLLPLNAIAGELSEVSAAQPLMFSLPDLAGQPRSLKEFTGKVLLVNFWASWCRPCIEEMPSIQRLAAAMTGAPFAIVGVNVGEAERRVRASVKRLGIELPVLLDTDSSVFKGWGADVLPTTYVLDGGGRVRYMGRGPVEWDRTDIVDMLRRLAVESSASEPGQVGE